MREFRNYTQSYMAGQLGIGQNTYSKIENGVIPITIGRLEKIALILGVTVIDMLQNDFQLFKFENRDVDTELKGSTHMLIQSLREEIHYLRDQNELLIGTLADRRESGR